MFHSHKRVQHLESNTINKFSFGLKCVQNIYKIVIECAKNIILVACVVQISIIGFYNLKGQQLYYSLTKIKP